MTEHPLLERVIISSWISSQFHRRLWRTSTVIVCGCLLWTCGHRGAAISLAPPGECFRGKARCESQFPTNSYSRITFLLYRIPFRLIPDVMGSDTMCCIRRRMWFHHTRTFQLESYRRVRRGSSSSRDTKSDITISAKGEISPPLPWRLSCGGCRAVGGKPKLSIKRVDARDQLPDLRERPELYAIPLGASLVIDGEFQFQVRDILTRRRRHRSRGPTPRPRTRPGQGVGSDPR